MRKIILFSFLLSIAHVLHADLVVQAEDGVFTGKTDTQHSGYTGTSFVDLTNAVGSTLLLEFSLAEEMPQAVVKTRWANGKSDDRSMSYTVNGEVQIAHRAFGSSGAFTTWVETIDTLKLRKGTNRLLLTALTSNGAPNLDCITIVGGAQGIREFMLNVKCQGKGLVVRTPDSLYYPQNSAVKLEAFPDAATQSSFVGWTGDTVSTEKIIWLVMDKVRTVTATFQSAMHTVYYCAPVEKGGSDSNPGTLEKPFFSLSKAVALMEPGDTVFMRGGVYRYTATIKLEGKGSRVEPFCIFNYPGEQPVLNFYDIFSSYGSEISTLRGSSRGFLLTGDHYYLKGLEICQAPDNGIKVEGSHNTMERLVLHHNGDSGIQIGLAKDDPDAADLVCNNTVRNCDSYRNLDWGTSYENADGYACKLSPGANNRFVGCRAWENADDGWDFYMTHFTIYIDSCWTMGNGNPELITVNDPDWEYGQKNTPPTLWEGDGNGFKLGGDDWAAKHQVRNCIAFDGYSTGAGFSENNNADSLFIFNCLAFQNIKNFRVRAYPSDVRNCIAFHPKNTGESAMFELADSSISRNNSWDLNGGTAMVPFKNFDQTSVYNSFVSLSKADFLAPRELDGSLPDNGFGKPALNSMFIDKGTTLVRGMDPYTLKSCDIHLTSFTGASIDMGAYEYEPGKFDAIETPNSQTEQLRVFPNPFAAHVLLETKAVVAGIARLQLFDLTGRALVDFGTQAVTAGEKRTYSLSGNQLNAGVYLAVFTNGHYSQALRVVKR